MPMNSGETVMCTLFGDVHYFFNAPLSKPQHHRFEKGSYVYLYHDTVKNKGRLEIANNAGKPEQDAFSGSLDTADLLYSHNHNCLVTLTVNIPTDEHSDAPNQEWSIPGPDIKNEGYYTNKLHTLDIYFWTKEDANQFVDSVQRILPGTQTKILDAPPAHNGAMSPVVQKLEQVAVTDPYHPVESGNASAVSTTFPSTTNAEGKESAATELPADYKPLAYNPAAPPAPEPIKHREKTPPPADAGSGTGLGHAATADEGLHFVPQPFQHQGTFSSQNPGYFPGPPTSAPPPGQAPGSQTTPAPVPSAFGPPQRTESFPPPFPSTGSAGPSPGQQYAHGFAPPPTTGSPQYGQGFAPPPQAAQAPGQYQYGTAPQQQYQYPGYVTQSPGQQQPLGSYSNYQYTGATGTPLPPPAPGQADPYNVHGVVYRPTENEQQVGHIGVAGVTVAGTPAAAQGPAQPQQPQGRLEASAAKVEKGVGRFLKRLEKKMG